MTSSAECDTCIEESETEEIPTTETTKQWVNLGLIVLDKGTQSRKETNQATIDDYAEQMAENRWQWEREPLPILFFDGTNYYPDDGHHRILAASQTREEIFAEVRLGTFRDAIFYSCQANRFHGLQRTRADKRNQAELLLKDSEWQTMSDRAIAEHCGVSAPFVGNVRRELVESGTVNVFSERTDKKGRTIETGNIGKRGTKRADSADGAMRTIAKMTIKNLHQTVRRTHRKAPNCTQIHRSQPLNKIVLKQACKVWKPKSVIEFAIKYATEDELQSIYELLGETIQKF